MKNKLKRYLFCKSTKVLLDVYTINWTEDVYRVVCSNCNTEGPTAENESKARKLWNSGSVRIAK